MECCEYSDHNGYFIKWSLGKGGFSIGFNLTPIGIPSGAGINIGWGNGGSVGAYGEVGVRVGGTGFGSGATISQSYNYGFKSGWSASTTAGVYASYGGFNVGASYGTSGWGVSAGIGFGDDQSGLGFSIGYGSGGWSYGIGGHYNPYFQQPQQAGDFSKTGGVKSGDQPPAIGDKKFIEGQGGSIVLLTYTADGWRVIGVIPGSGAVVPTDSPIEWILGAWKAPIQAVDNVGVLGFAKIMGGNISPIISGFSKHGLNQAISRGFKTADILKIVRNGNSVSAMGRYGSQVRYTLGQNTVVLNAKNQVVTVFSTAKNGMFVR